eukprot:12429573-Karenia_brevis.AAC.1
MQIVASRMEINGLHCMGNVWRQLLLQVFMLKSEEIGMELLDESLPVLRELQSFLATASKEAADLA